MSQKVLYLDPWSGVSGDMTLAALLDAGGLEAEQVLRRAIDSMGLEGVEVEVEHEIEWGVACTRVKVRAETAPPLRRLKDMVEVIERAKVSDTIKAQARAAITRLAEVEAGIHGCPVDHIHFHEVGAADTLVDVVGTFVLVEALQVDRVFVGSIPLGGGWVEIAHGRMAVPAPATVALLTGYEAVGGPEARELTTPTGALLVGQLGAIQGPMPAMKLQAVGYGAGATKLQGGPNVLRVVLGEVAEGSGPREAAGEAVIELRTNIDDISAEVIGHTLQRLREAGALDAWTVPVQMKKDRPGVVLHVLATPALEGGLVDIVFAETGTLGIRRVEMERYVAERGTVPVTVDGEAVTVKWGRWRDHLNLAPEYEEAARAAAALGRPLRQVMHEATDSARHLLQKGDGV